MTRLRTTVWTIIAGAALVSAGGSAHAQAPAGVTAAVNPQATGTPPALPTRVLEVGSNVVQNEHLSTGPEGQAQLLFRDGSSVTLGPGSDLTIDNFVYDPDARTAKLAMSATTGVFRFVGGRASKDEPVVLNTPTATIGIRGGINYTTVASGSGETETSQAYGRDTTATSKSTGDSQVLTKSGFSMTIKSNEPITTGKFDFARLNAMLSSFQGRPGTTGGGTAPNQNSAQAQGVANANSNQSPALNASPLTSNGTNAQVISGSNQLVGQTAQTDRSSLVAQNTTIPTTTITTPTTVPGLSTNSGLSGAFADQFNGSDYTIDPTSQVVGANGRWMQINDSGSEKWTVGTAQFVEVSGDQDIQIGRLTNGTVTVQNYFSSLNACTGTQCTRTYGPNQGFNYVIGIPSLSMPTSGSFTFGLTGATSPTFGDGHTAPGTFLGSLSVVFGSPTQIRLLATVAIPGDATYTFSPSSFITTSGSIFVGTIGVSFSGTPHGACTSAATCQSVIQGLFAGSGATKAGLSYIIGNNVSGCCTGSSSIIVGAALFHR